MSTLQFYVGGAGSGKSHRLFSYIHEKAKKEPGRSCLVIVPEQFTLQTQKALVKMQASKAIMNIDVLSFQRLAYRVFDDLGKTKINVLAENGKNLVLRRVAQELGGEMTVLRAQIKKMGFISEMKSLLSELMQYRISPADLLTLSESGEKTYLSEKLKDVAGFYREFQKFISGKAVTAEGVLELLIEYAEESELISGSTIILDAFTGFTPIQLALLEKIMPMAGEIKVSVTADKAEPLFGEMGEEDLFSMSGKMVKALMRLAKKTGTETLPPVEMGEPAKARFQNSPAMAHLEKNLFRTKPERYPKETKGICLMPCKTPYEELVAAAQKIRELVREEGWRYRDIAVVTADLPTYAAQAREVFDAYHIPIFLDQNEAVHFHPLTEGIRGILRILKEDWSAESVFHFLRTGLLPFGREEIDELETKALATGVRGSRWKKEFTSKDEKEEAKIARLNEIRETLLSEIKPFQEAFRKKDRTALEECRVFYEFLLQIGAEEKMEALAEEQEAAGELRKAGETRKIYEIIIEFIDKTSSLLETEPLSVEEFLELYEAALENAKVGILPEGYDRVIIGDMERSRFGELKALFILGVNDGVVPKIVHSGSLLSEPERKVMAEQGYELSPSPRERAFIQRFYLYMNTLKPSERLYLSWSALDKEWKTRKPSYFVNTIRSLFPKARGENLILSTETPESGIRGLISGLKDFREGKEDASFLTLAAWYDANDPWKDRVVPLYEAAFLTRQEEALSKALVKRLYNKEIKASVTRLECFALCPARHFFQYVLGLQERDLHEFRVPDFGTLLHDALSSYGERLGEMGIPWDQVKERQEEILTAAMEKAQTDWLERGFFSGGKGEYDLHYMKRVMKRTVEALSYQLGQGRYVPAAFELPFGPGAKEKNSASFLLGDGNMLRLTGRIDRVDVAHADGKNDLFVKVLDYKTGDNKLNADDIYYGLSLQLPVYTLMAKEHFKRKNKGENIRIGGMLYYLVKEPVLEEKRGIPEAELKEMLMGELKPTGMVNAEDEALSCIDRNFAMEGVSGSNVVRVKKKKDGGFTVYSQAYTEEQLEKILDFTKKKICAMGEEIFSGIYLPAPVKKEDRDSCTYCRYRSVCGYDEEIPGYRHKKLKPLKEDEAFTKMKGEEKPEQ